MEENNIYDENYFASFPDPLLSKKLLSFSMYPNEEQFKQQLIESKITKDIYGYEPQVVYYNGVGQIQNIKPTYYQGARHSNIELNQFKASDQFLIFSRELDQCFAYINQWIIEQKLNIEYMERSVLGKEMLRIIPAQEEFNFFLNRLNNGYYEALETDMYGDGKKYLEKLAILIHANDIDLTFRKNQVISLLSDEGLRRCMGGCLTVLDMAVSNLENYGVYRPDRLISRFFLDILKTSTIKAPKLHGSNVVSQISQIIKIDLSISEVHIYNYLLQRAKNVFGLNFLILPEDAHINLITDPYSSDNRIKGKIDKLFQDEFINPIKAKLRTTDLVKFIADQIREKLRPGSNPLEDINKLELWLSELGKDNSFNKEDFLVINNNNYKLKLDFSLEITITERLFDFGWLELDLHDTSRLFKRSNYFFERNKGIFSIKPNLFLVLQPYKLIYKIYYSNLELSWIKINEKKLRILDFISTKNNLPNLINVMGTSPHPLINSLLQTPYDMDLFFQFLAPDDLSVGLSWVNKELSTSFATPSDKSVVWMYQFTKDTERYSKILESVSSNVQKRLFLHLIENFQPFPMRLQVIIDELVKLPSRSQKELHTIMQLRYGSIYEIINNLLRLDIRNFSGLTFPSFHCKKCLISISSPIYTYLMHINFENCNLDSAIFNTYIKNCKFNKANLQHTKFMKSVISSSFENTDLTTTIFMGANFMNLNLYGAIFSTQSFLTLMQRTHTTKNQAPIADFRGADLRQVNFQTHAIQHELSKRIIDFSNALLQDTNLSGLFRRETNIVFLGHANLDGTQLRKCKLADIHTMFTSMRGVVTDETVLSIDQLFQLYHQGHRDFSTDYIADTDSKINFFNRETLSGALISPQIFLALVNNGFKNFDQAQLSSATRTMRNQHHLYPKLLTSRSLQDRKQRVRLERLEQGQQKFQELQEIISETLNYRQISKLHVINQAELFHSYLFEAKNLEIHGRCIQLTSAFSEALIRNKQAVYKNNLFVISELDKREILHKPLSKQEQNDRKNFLEGMRQFEENSADGSITLPSWIHDKTITIKDIDALVEYIQYPKQDFAWHISLIESRKQIGHVLGVYRIEGKYAFFDSNVGYIDNISNKETFVSFLKRIIKRSYLIHRDMKIYVDQYTPDIELKKNPKINDSGLDNRLFTVFLTEQQRLAKLDESGYLIINNQLIDRKTLYKIGFSYHEDGNLNLPGRLIDSEMYLDQKFLDNGLKNNKFSINSHYFQEFLLKYIQEEKKSLINQSLTRKKYSVDIKTLHTLLSLPTYQMFKNPIPIKTLEPLFDSFSSPLKRKTDLRTINKLLKKAISPSQIFIAELEKNQFQKSLIERLNGIGRKVPLPKALAGLIATKSFFDIGLSLAQNNYQAALLQSLMFSYGLFAEPWVEQSIIKLPKKIANFINTHSSVFKISDKVLDTKRIVIPTRLFAGTAANVLDIVSLSSSINEFMESEYGTKKWRDAIADITIDSASLFTGSALVIANPSFGVGLGAGVFLIIIKSSYDGASLLMEYSAHNLTWVESIKTFFYGSIGLSAPERVLYLHSRQEQMDKLVEFYWKNLQALQQTFPTENIIAYGGGLGEHIKHNKKCYHEKTLNPVNNKIRKINNELGKRGKIPFLTESVGDTNPGISAILPYNTPSNFKENLSRLTPKKPDEENIQYLCLPTFRNESIEIQSNIKLKKKIPEVTFSCTNAVVILDTKQLKNLNEAKYKKVFLNMEYIYDGLIQKIPDFENNFFIFNGTTNFVARSDYGRPTRNLFFIKKPYFSGNISLEGETNSLLILEDNSDIRTYNITLLPNQTIMDVVAETFTGDFQGKFKTKNFSLVVGRRQKQDKYSCHYPINDTIPFSIELQGLGGGIQKTRYLYGLS